MSRLRVLLAVAAGFVAGAYAMLWVVDRLFGGSGPRIEIGPSDEPGGGWQW